VGKRKKIEKILCLLQFHKWETHMHNLRADEDPKKIFVIAWKQCSVCAVSKLIFILE